MRLRENFKKLSRSFQDEELFEVFFISSGEIGREIGLLSRPLNLTISCKFGKRRAKLGSQRLGNILHLFSGYRHGEAIGASQVLGGWYVDDRFFLRCQMNFCQSY